MGHQYNIAKESSGAESKVAFRGTGPQDSQLPGFRLTLRQYTGKLRYKFLARFGNRIRDPKRSRGFNMRQLRHRLSQY